MPYDRFAIFVGSARATLIWKVEWQGGRIRKARSRGRSVRPVSRSPIVTGNGVRGGSGGLCVGRASLDVCLADDYESLCGNVLDDCW